MTKTQNYLLHIVSQIPPSESPLNALLTRQNVEAINEQTTETTRDVYNNIVDLKEKISKYVRYLFILTKQGKGSPGRILGDFRFIERPTSITKDEITTNSLSISCVQTTPYMSNISELSHQRTAYATSKRMLTQGLQQFIKDNLATILLAESKGALPGEPKSLPKKKRRRDEEEDDDNPERALAARMIALVEVRRLIFLTHCRN